MMKQGASQLAPKQAEWLQDSSLPKIKSKSMAGVAQ
jgi:hypothetical protein